MGTFMGYMVQVAAIMTILYLVYKLLMSGLSFHSFNRKIILGIYVVSWSLPAFMSLLTTTTTQTTLTDIGDLEMTPVIFVESEPVKEFDWTSIAAIVYFSGILIMTAITLFSIWRMTVIIRGGRLIKSRNHYIIKESVYAPGPFSWGKYIIVRPSDIDDSLDLVIAHEATHLLKRHWIDLIPARVTIILQWFSPAAWLLARELREVHEFEVDEIVADENIYEYQLMLIKKTAGSRFPVFADSLNHSQIKKRLTMMKKKSNPKRRVAALLLPLSACAAVLLLAQPVVASVIDRLASTKISLFDDNKINENDQHLQITEVDDQAKKEKSSSISASLVHSDVVVASDDDALNELSAKDAISDIEEKSSRDSKLTYFIDGKEFKGSISDIDPSTIASMQVVKNDPAYPDSKIMITTKQGNSSDAGTNDEIEKTAQFKGGEKELLAFLSENIKYPASEMDSPVNTVRVTLNFNILTDGSVDDIVVSRSGGEMFDAEAIEVVKKTSGRWLPAEIKGKPVVSQLTIPITFKKKP